MSDRDLLEKAAKAAGYVVESMRSNGGAWCHPVGEQPDEDGDHPGLFSWHPLADDGDALRLAVKLRIDVNYGGTLVVAAQVRPHDVGRCDPIGIDPYAATRRCIVRAAAAIGESMK